MKFLDDEGREFVASEYLKLEVLPKAYFHRSTAEIALYEEYFSSATMIVPFDVIHFAIALKHACDYGLSEFDALHLTIASRAGCAEFITSEKRSSPIFRFPGIRIRALD